MLMTKDLSTCRVPVMGSVHLNPVGSFPSRVLCMLDLSSGGFFVQTAFPLPVGTRLSCHFHLGDHPDPLHVQAEVAWIRPGPENMSPPPGMGLRFVRLPHTIHERILRVIEAHNEHIQYFQEHQKLHEDAMRWKVPRVLLQLEDTSIATHMEAWNGRFQVLTMALPFEQGQVVTTRTDDGSVEHGRIAWMQFVPNGPQGAEMQLGIELQMHSWGQQMALRRPTGEIAFNETGDPEAEYEIVQSVPASMTIAPTLPLRENTHLQTATLVPCPLPSNESKPNTQTLDDPHTSATVPIGVELTTINLSPARIMNTAPSAAVPSDFNSPQNHFHLTETKAPLPATIPATHATSIVRRPAPVLPSDTYPVATPFVRWPLTKRATALLFSVGLMIYILLILHPLSLPTPQNLPSTLTRLRPTQLREVLGAKPPLYTPTRGKSIATSASFSKSTLAPIADAYTNSSVVLQSSTLHVSNTKPQDTTILNTTDLSARKLSFQVTSHAHTTTLMLPGFGGKTQHYLLANPSGVVLDIENARFAVASGMYPGDARHIRKVKVIPMNKKTRLIIYTQSLPEKVEILSQSNALQVKLTFSEKIAKR